MNEVKSVEARKRIGLQLLKKRELLGWTQEVLAEKLNVSRSTVAKIENGRWSFSIDYLDKFCEALNLKVELNEK